MMDTTNEYPQYNELPKRIKNILDSNEEYQFFLNEYEELFELAINLTGVIDKNQTLWNDVKSAFINLTDEYHEGLLYSDIEADDPKFMEYIEYRIPTIKALEKLRDKLYPVVKMHYEAKIKKTH